MTLLDIKQKLRPQIMEAAARHGAKNIRVFGSVARGEDRPDSDVDFLVEMEPERHLLDRIALIHELEELLGRRVDVVTEKAVSPYIKEDVLREAVQL